MREVVEPMAPPVAAAEAGDEAVAWFDWLTWPALVIGGLVATAVLVARVEATVATVIVTAGAVVILFALERVRPQRRRGPRADSVWAAVGHFLVGAEVGTVVGYGLAVAIGGALARAHGFGAGVWPSGWPIAAQVGLALLLADLASYWQHRGVHLVRGLWPFHALHHQPRQLDLLVTGRFHVVDFGSATLLAYLPVIALGAPAVVLPWLAIVTALLGVLQHANVRMPTPAWLDAVVCTPAAHWRHHSRAAADDGNFATTCTLIDRLFGTWVATGGRRPAALGLADDPLPPGWLPSIVAPFRRRPA